MKLVLYNRVPLMPFVYRVHLLWIQPTKSPGKPIYGVTLIGCANNWQALDLVSLFADKLFTCRLGVFHLFIFLDHFICGVIFWFTTGIQGFSHLPPVFIIPLLPHVHASYRDFNIKTRQFPDFYVRMRKAIKYHQAQHFVYAIRTKSKGVFNKKIGKWLKALLIFLSCWKKWFDEMFYHFLGFPWNNTSGGG